jgi:surface polysaccharide O-acyltransferase-like enzyme
MDDLQITISLTELMTLIESAKRVSDAEKALSSLSRRLDGLYGIYTEVLERLRALQHEVDSL